MNTFTTINDSYAGWKDGKTHILSGRTKREDPADEKLIALCGLKCNPLMVSSGNKECDCKKCLKLKI